MIVVTGASGFIASCLCTRLNEEHFNDLVLVDDFSREDRIGNWQNKRYHDLINRDNFFAWLDQHHEAVQFVFHLGARTDTTEMNREVLNALNLEYSKKVWNACVAYGLPLIYASSAATYGLGENGYVDDEQLCNKLKPLNPYGESKNEFDKWALAQADKPFFWAGLKFFNVYGPNEYHKKRMASVIFHAYHQIQESGKVKLFRSHRDDYTDGGQMRDFVYVKDVVSMAMFLMKNRPKSGIYNVGSGKARSFKDLALAVFAALGKEPQIEFVDTPEDIRDKYQYFTEAHMDKMRSVGYDKPFHSLEEGVTDYVLKYLVNTTYL
jgi:ADP-L-glycero-D-manno-heptose 6-epimerase